PELLGDEVAGERGERGDGQHAEEDGEDGGHGRTARSGRRPARTAPVLSAGSMVPVSWVDRFVLVERRRSPASSTTCPRSRHPIGTPGRDPADPVVPARYA